MATTDVNSSYMMREATLTDLPTLLGFEQEIVAWERPYAPNIKDGVVNYYDIRDLIEREDAHVLVAVNAADGALIGSGYAKIKTNISYKDPDQLTYLGFMYTAPAYRGKGVNGSIIHTLVQWAKDRGVHEVQLDVYADNASALQAYAKAGFKPDLLTMRLR